MVNSTSPNSEQLLRSRTLCFEIVGASKEILRKTDVKRGMATSNVTIVSFYSGRAQKLQNRAF